MLQLWRQDYDEELRAWLVVGALNANGIEIRKKQDGKRELIIKSGM